MCVAVVKSQVTHLIFRKPNPARGQVKQILLTVQSELTNEFHAAEKLSEKLVVAQQSRT
jgi:hypothetical protein